MRRRLSFTIDEWLALPWWQRRIYLEGLNAEAEAQAGDGDSAPAGGSQSSGMTTEDAILYGGAGDVAAAGFST